MNDYVGVYQEAARYDEDGTIEERNPALMRQLRQFADQWDLNLKHQGFIEAFQRQHACTLNGAQIGATSANQ